MTDWKEAIETEWKRRRNGEAQRWRFPLIAQGFDSREIIDAVDVLLSGRITMGERVAEFERRFASIVGAPHAIMVNSGSSANLLAVSALVNPARAGALSRGDEVLVPAVCWPTSIWPAIQLGLKAVLVDVDPSTLNMSMDDLRRKITSRSRAVMAVHILGNSSPMDELLDITRTHGLKLIEDTCESLGSRSGAKTLGTSGDFGTYSFYYSHHITTGEGGMVVCGTQEDDDLLRCLRAHGWSRELSNRTDVQAANPDIDPRFLFVNTGYNVRPTEVAAAFGLRQLERLATMNATRNRNLAMLRETLLAHPGWRDQIEFPLPSPGTEPAWFGAPMLLAERFAPRKQLYLDYLTSRGVENRPIVSGNFARQPALRLLGVDLDPAGFPGAERVGRCGFFIGLHTEPIEASDIAMLADILLGYELD
jgi:CDP-6-deoxy-D-xylo-4-hexulose-3-dehydrase